MLAHESPMGKTVPPMGRFFNSGYGSPLVPLDIGHATHMGVINPDTAFWALVQKEKLAELLTNSDFIATSHEKGELFSQEMEGLRFGLTPSAVYFNATDRCNLDCPYCYIPQEMRREGSHMSRERLLEALARLKNHFSQTMPPGRLPRIIFHGAEPLLNKEAIMAGIEAFHEDFLFGLQTNATLLDEETITFLVSRKVSIGLSLDGPTAQITNRTRFARSGRVDVHAHVMAAMKRLEGYEGYSVIVTVTRENAQVLPQLVELLHQHRVPTCLLNMTRCTLPAAREMRLGDLEAAEPFLQALDVSHRLYKETGQKLVVANFANILLAILAPTARRLMCDISPCGGGRAFVALSANGDLFPCSEFIGLDEFRGGNLFDEGGMETAMISPAFTKVTSRNVDHIKPCQSCAIRHFCGSPCPAEAHEMNGGMDQIGAFCAFYEDQVRYAFRAIADGKANDFLWDGWDDGVQTVLNLAGTIAGCHTV